MDAQSLDFADESFDVVLLPWVLQMVRNLMVAVRQAARVLKLGGRLIVIGLLSAADYDQIIARFVNGMSGGKIRIGFPANVYIAAKGS